MMFFKSTVFLLVASQTTSGLTLREGTFFDSVANDVAEPTEDSIDQATDDAFGTVPPEDGMPPHDFPEEGEEPVGGMTPGPSNIVFTSVPSFWATFPPMPIVPPPEEEKSEFILKISNGAELQPLIDKFMTANPNATLTGTYDNEPFGFAVAGVTETDIKMFANSCANLVLDIFKLFQAHAGGEVGGDACVPKPPSGTITMEVKYDYSAYETHFSLWKLEGQNWTSLEDYPPPNMYPQDKQVVTVQLEDGFYSMDVVDMAHNGMQSNPYDPYYTGGHFKLIETDSAKELYKGADFGTYVTVEFAVADGVVTVSNVKTLKNTNSWY